MKFNLYDVVTWVSQAQGMARRKVGTIVRVIPPKGDPGTAGCGYPRTHESYVVSVPGKTTRAKPKMYWPVVSRLSLAKASHTPGSTYV